MVLFSPMNEVGMFWVSSVPHSHPGQWSVTQIVQLCAERASTPGRITWTPHNVHTYKTRSKHGSTDLRLSLMVCFKISYFPFCLFSKLFCRVNGGYFSLNSLPRFFVLRFLSKF